MEENIRFIGKYISMLHRASLVNLADRFREFNVTTSEYLFIINIPEEASVTQAYLSKMLYVDKALTTKVIQSLVAKGFVRKKRSENDGRAFDIQLTEEGTALKPKILEILQAWVDTITEGMADEQKREVLLSLIFMAENIPEKKSL